MTDVLHLADGARSTSPLTREPRIWYGQILGKEPLIKHKWDDLGRCTVFRNEATPIRVSKSSGQPDSTPRRTAFGRSRNNARLPVCGESTKEESS